MLWISLAILAFVVLKVTRCFVPRSKANSSYTVTFIISAFNEFIRICVRASYIRVLQNYNLQNYINVHV